MPSRHLPYCAVRPKAYGTAESSILFTVEGTVPSDQIIRPKGWRPVDKCSTDPKVRDKPKNCKIKARTGAAR